MRVNFGSSDVDTVSEDALGLYSAIEILECITDGFVDEIDSSEESVSEILVIGRLVDWIKHINDHSLKSLQKSVPQCLKQIKSADESKFGDKKLLQVKVMSKYLPDWKDFASTVKTLNKAIVHLTSITDVRKFDEDKFISLFSGSVYANGNKQPKDIKLGAMALGLVQKDIRLRGWTTKAAFISALESMQSLVGDMERLHGHTEKLKPSKDGDDKKSAASYAKSVKTTLKLVGFLGRGLVTASRKMCSNALGKIFTTQK